MDHAERQKGWRSKCLYLHGVIAAASIYVFAWRWPAVWLLPLIFGSHILVDWIKARARDTGRAFTLDQAAHAAVLLGCWVTLSPEGARLLADAVPKTLADPRVWLCAVSYLSLFWPAGLLIGRVTAPFRLQLDRDSCHPGGPQVLGLDKAGLWIGRFERMLILTFVLIGHLEAIGFLIAAKSILRLGEGGASGGRKETEYILIGTLLSFTIALGVGMLCHYGIRALSTMAAG